MKVIVTLANDADVVFEETIDYRTYEGELEIYSDSFLIATYAEGGWLGAKRELDKGETWDTMELNEEESQDFVSPPTPFNRRRKN